MCGSTVDIQSPTAEIRQGKERKKERKIEITGQKYNGLPYYRVYLQRAFIRVSRCVKIIQIYQDFPEL